MEGGRSVSKDFVEIAVDRMIAVLEDDDELRQALIRFINGKAQHENWLAELAAAKAKKLLGEI